MRPGEVDVWLCFPDEARDPDLLRSYEEISSASEKAQRARQHFARHRHLDLVARALTRTTLTRYAAVDPASWRFVCGPDGRPEPAASGGVPNLRFSLSHTADLVACAVTLEDDIGVDVEIIRPYGDLESLARYCLTPEEVAAIDVLPLAARPARFTEYWTLREAYTKARGVGLTVPLQSISFALDAQGRFCLAADESCADAPGAWDFFVWHPTERHRGSLAVQRGAHRSRQVRVHAITPLAAHTERCLHHLGADQRPCSDAAS